MGIRGTPGAELGLFPQQEERLPAGRPPVGSLLTHLSDTQPPGSSPYLVGVAPSPPSPGMNGVQNRGICHLHRVRLPQAALMGALSPDKRGPQLCCEEGGGQEGTVALHPPPAHLAHSSGRNNRLLLEISFLSVGPGQSPSSLASTGPT